MRRHQLLQRLHRLLQPRSYFEIGVREGKSLELSRTRTIAVDPFFLIDREIQCDLHLVRTSSDEFFARKNPLAYFDPPLIDLAFIDGMHLSEYVLRDIMNVMRHCHPGSVIVIDDALPRSVVEAGRTRQGAARGGFWAGDVYKVVPALLELRPDLAVFEMDTTPTGTVVIMGIDARSRVLDRAYDDLVEAFVVEDPQEVPLETLTRARALSPQRLLDTPIWEDVKALRELPPDRAMQRIDAILNGAGLRHATVSVAG